MPIYEFYCVRCHKIYKFLSRRADVAARPGCPVCGRAALERQVSTFAVSRNRPEKSEAEPGGDGEDPLSGLDESKLERAMGMLEREAEGIDEDDPRQAARFMKKLYEATGLELGPTMEEAIQRMEKGEDPDSIEEDLGDAMEKEDPLAGAALKEPKTAYRRLRPPVVDDNLYDL
jgi:putative FmdB family regulatory protein